MGIPVFVKLDEQYSLPIFQKMTEEVDLKRIPLILVDEENLEEKLEELVKNPEKIKSIGKEGIEWPQNILKIIYQIMEALMIGTFRHFVVLK